MDPEGHRDHGHVEDPDHGGGHERVEQVLPDDVPLDRRVVDREAYDRRGADQDEERRYPTAGTANRNGLDVFRPFLSTRG